jgi:type II secretory ATPase GspE/PulE/Tfp pilus assembly ATPase PilB-like protein
MANLGLRKPLQDTLYHIVHRQNGLLLCCGPTGAGKSTTLYATLSEVDPYQKNIITVEDPIEFRMDNVTQIEVDRKRDQTFDSLLKSVLRQDPDVVMVGEMNDAETARTGCQASTTGHMVFSTVHANDAVTALFRLIDLGVEPYLVANSVTAVLGQRLVRRLCGQCKVPYKPKVEFLRQAGLPPEKIACFFRPPPASGQPCAACSGLGFRGRVGLFELLVVSDPMRDLVRQRAPLATVRGEARKGGMRSLKEEGLLLVAAGVTSVDELLRVIQ